MLNTIVYYEFDDTPEAVKYVNENLIKCMIPDFLHSPSVHLRAEADFGYNQAEMVTIPNNAEMDVILEKLQTLKDS